MEADDEGLYVTKFRAAGQGERALVAEVVAGELARAIGLPVPDLVVVEVAPALGLAEPDPEIQDLIVGSPGANLGMDFLPGALPPALPADPAIGAELAADVVWFDALVTNVDRTPRNPNLLDLARPPVPDRPRRSRSSASTATVRSPRRPATRRPMLAEHVLLPVAGSLEEADERLADRRWPRSTTRSRWCRTRGSAPTRRPAAPTSRLPARAARAAAAFVKELQHA